MSIIKASDIPLFAKADVNGDDRTQYGALCYRRSGKKTEILLITSRDTGRWVVPKGWPKRKTDPVENVMREAWEEAGVRGTPSDRPIGFYTYDKLMDDGRTLPCVVALFTIKTSGLASDFPEKGQRRRKWFAPAKAAARVAEPELAKLLRRFKP